MQVLRHILFLSALWLSAAAENKQEQISTTEYLDITSYETTTNPPEDNGMIIPREENLNPPSAKEEEPSALEETPTVTFPDNHKNFTPSQYLGEDFPPYYNYLSPYQQQYKNYFEQKQIYSRKPIKFEENSFKNVYLPPEANSLDVGDEKKVEGFRVNRNPFPYVFELQKPHDSKEHVIHHQENIVPYYIYHHDYPREEKHYKNDHYQVKKEGNPWKKVFHVLTALVPLGLILATLTPNVISINSTATTKTTRQRSEDSSPFRFEEEDVIKLMKKYGVDTLSEAQCEDRIICELALEGGSNAAGPIEKGFWFLANQTPWNIAEEAGMKDLFKAIKTRNCDTFKCQKSGLKKKLIRKHKITW